METSVQGARKNAKKGRNKTTTNVAPSFLQTSTPSTHTELRPIDLVEEELDNYYFESKKSKKRKNKMQAEYNLCSYFPQLIRDYTQEELDAEGCRKLPSTPQPAEAPKPLSEDKAGPQPVPQAEPQSGPQSGGSPGQPKPAENEKNLVPAVKMSYSAVVSSQKQVTVKKPLTSQPQPGPKHVPQPVPQSRPKPVLKPVLQSRPKSKPKPVQFLEQPKPAETPQKPVSAFKITFGAPESDEEQVSEKKPLTKLNTNLQQTKQAVIQIPELDHSPVTKKDQVSRLEEEKVALRHEVEQLKDQLKSHEAKATSREAHMEMEKLRESLEAEKQRHKETEENLALQTEETTKLKASLSQVVWDINNREHLWGQERFFLIGEIHKLQQTQSSETRSHLPEEVQTESSITEPTENQAPEDQSTNNKQQLQEETSHHLSEQKEISELKAALNQAQEQLETQRQQWEEERSRLLEEQKEKTCSMEAALKQAQEDTNSMKSQWEKEKFDFLIKQMEERQMIQTVQKQVQENMNRLQHLWDRERSHLISVQEKESVRMEAALCQAKEKLEKNRRLWEEERSKLLEKHREDSNGMSEQLQQAQMELMSQKSQLEVDRSQLLTEQRESYKLKTSLKQVQEDLDQQQAQWQQEKASLLESIQNSQQTPVREEEEEVRAATPLMDSLRILDGQIEEVTKERKKKSVGKRFLGLFKRNRNPPVMTSDPLP